MGDAVLVKGGIIACSHGGQLRLQFGNAFLKAAGAEVVTASMEIGLSFAPAAPGVTVPCPLPAPSGPPSSSPCTATAPANRGKALKLKVGGQPALLASAGGSCINANDPAATWSVTTAGQTKVTAS